MEYVCTYTRVPKLAGVMCFPSALPHREVRATAPGHRHASTAGRGGKGRAPRAAGLTLYYTAATARAELAGVGHEVTSSGHTVNSSPPWLLPPAAREHRASCASALPPRHPGGPSSSSSPHGKEFPGQIGRVSKQQPNQCGAAAETAAAPSWSDGALLHTVAALPIRFPKVLPVFGQLSAYRGESKLGRFRGDRCSARTGASLEPCVRGTRCRPSQSGAAS